MKVCILAAGIGGRLGNLTKNFNKAFIRIGDMGAISHIINYFPKHYEFIITTGYLGDELEQYVKLCHPDLNIRFVKNVIYSGSGAGPGYSLNTCNEFLQEPFYIWTTDTLVNDFSITEDHNWIGYCEAKNEDGEYSCVDVDGENVINNFYEKKENVYTNNAYIGCSFVLDYENFWKGMANNPITIQNQFQVSAGFNSLLQNNIVYGKKLQWHDTGNLEKLQKTREQFPAKIKNLDKDDEEIYFFNNEFVVKYFKDENFAQNRIKRNITLGNTVPKIFRSSKNFYVYEYIVGKDLFAIDKPQECFLNLLNFANEQLWQPRKLNPEEFKKFQETCVDFYYKKTKIRLDKLYEKLHLYDKQDTINYKKIPLLNDILENLDWPNLLNGKPTLMHGDFNFSNIIFQNNNSFKFIDWRQDFGGMLEVGDMYYDLAKMYSGFLFPHDTIKEGSFQLKIERENVEVHLHEYEKYTECKKIFINFLNEKNIDTKKVKQLAAIVLLNMSPLHEFPLNVYLYYCGKYLLWKYVNER